MSSTSPTDQALDHPISLPKEVTVVSVKEKENSWTPQCFKKHHRDSGWSCFLSNTAESVPDWGISNSTPFLSQYDFATISIDFLPPVKLLNGNKTCFDVQHKDF